MRNYLLFCSLLFFSFLNAQLPSRFYKNKAARERIQRSGDIEKADILPFVKSVINGKTILLPKRKEKQNFAYSPIGSDAKWVKSITGPPGNALYWSPTIISNYDDQSSIFVCTYFEPGEGKNILLLKLDNYGNENWRVEYNNPISGDDEFQQIAVSDSGDIYLLATIRDSDYIIRYHILKFSQEGQLIGNSPIDNSEKWMWKTVFLSKEGRLYHSDRLKYLDDSGRWYVEIFAENGIREARYESELYAWWGTIITDLTVAPDGSFMTTVMAGNSIFFNRFDAGGNFQWRINTVDIGMNESDFQLIYTTKIIDKNNNFYFPDLAYLSVLKGLYCISGEGRVKWIYQSSYIDYIGFGLDDSLNISIVTTDNWYLDSDCEVYFTKLDSGGNIEIENRKNSLLVPQEGGRRRNFVFSEKTGYFAVLTSLFNSDGDLIGTTDGFGDPLFVNDKLFTYKTEKIFSLNYNLTSDWEYSLRLPVNNKTYLRDAFLTMDDEIIALVRNAEGADYQFSIVKMDESGNIIWAKPISFTGSRYTGNIFFKPVSSDRFLVISIGSSDTQNEDRKVMLFSKLFDMDGRIINDNIYSIKAIDFMQKPVYKNSKIYFVGSIRYEEQLEENTFYGSYIKALIFDDQGKLTFEKNISEINNEKFSYTYAPEYFVDNQGVINVLVTGASKSTPGTPENYFSGVYQISDDGDVEFFKTDFEFPGCTLVKYYHDSWENFYCTWLGGCTETGELVVKLAQIDSRGVVKWQKHFPLNSENWAYPNLTEANTKGQLAFFIEGWAPLSSEILKTQFYLISRGGEVILDKDIGKTDIGLLHRSPMGNDIILLQDGVECKVSILDIKNAMIKYTLSQTDLRGRVFSPKSFSFAEDNKRLFVFGNRFGSYYSTAETEIICFEMNDSIDYSIEDKRITTLGSFPNPSNSQAAIRYILPENGEVTVVMYNSLGREVKRDKLYQENGEQAYYFHNTTLASGQYFYIITQNHRSVSGKLLYLK